MERREAQGSRAEGPRGHKRVNARLRRTMGPPPPQVTWVPETWRVKRAPVRGPLKGAPRSLALRRSSKSGLPDAHSEPIRETMGLHPSGETGEDERRTSLNNRQARRWLFEI